MHIVSYEVVSEPIVWYGKRHGEHTFIGCNGGLKVFVKAQLRCPVCNNSASSSVSTDGLEIPANKQAIEHDIEKNLPIYVNNLCNADRHCEYCGVVSQIPRSPAEILLAELKMLITSEWVEAKLVEHGINPDQELRESYV